MSSKGKKYDYPSSDSGGVKPMNIRGIFEDERLRLTEEFTDEERNWRKQWIKDQKLSPSEPRHVPELEKELRNPIRRFLSVPWQFMEKQMIPVFGTTFSTHFRYIVPKLLVSTMFVYYTYYHLKYNQNDWTRVSGWKVYIPKSVSFPGDSDFPAQRERFEPSDYADRGFKSRKVFLD